MVGSITASQFSLERLQWNILHVAHFLFINSFTSLRSKCSGCLSILQMKNLKPWQVYTQKPPRYTWQHWDLNPGQTSSNLSCYYCAICLSKHLSSYLLLAAHCIVNVFIHSLSFLVGGLLYSNSLACYLLDVTEGS